MASGSRLGLIRSISLWGKSGALMWGRGLLGPNTYLYTALALRIPLPSLGGDGGANGMRRERSCDPILVQDQQQD